MFNLMVTAGDHSWEEGTYIWDKPRIFEYTPEKIRENFGALTPEELSALAKLPTLFMYERGTEGTPRIGKIKEIKGRNKEVRIEFDFDPSAPALTLGQIEGLKWHLQMEDFEFSRTHWAVKDVDLDEVLGRLPVDHEAKVIGALDAFNDEDKTLEELIGAIQRDIRAGKYAASLDRLHTYCVKRFRYLLDKRNIPNDREEPLHSYVGKYVKNLRKTQSLPAFTEKFMKGSIAAFEELNHIRNNQSLAHDNDLLAKPDAQFIFEAVAMILRFIKTVEEDLP